MEIFTCENFCKEVLEATVPVLVEFSAVWCGPCKAMIPILENLSEEYSGKIGIGKLDIEDSSEIAMKYGIMNVPTVLIFRDGKVKVKLAGLQKEKELRKAIESVL